MSPVADVAEEKKKRRRQVDHMQPRTCATFLGTALVDCEVGHIG